VATITYRGGVGLGSAVSPPRLVAAVAAVTALVGFLFTAQTIANYSPLAGFNTEQQAGDLSMWVRQSEVLSHEHSDHSHDDETGDAAGSGNEVAEDPTFAMSASMMPGTPEEGFQRLQVELDFMNKGSGVVSTGPPNFYLEGKDGLTWAAMRGGTFGVTSLRPLEVLSTVLAFDIPAEVGLSDVELVWVTARDEIHFGVSEGGSDNAGHSHG